MPTPIINDQLDSVNQNLIDLTSAVENLPFAGVPEAVADWLDAHPEATTTVQDGAISWAKLADDVKGPTKYVVRTIEADANNSSQIAVGCDFGIWDELTILIYQSDTTTYGDVWSDSASAYITIRDASAGSADGYIRMDSINNDLSGAAPLLIRAKRIPDAIIAERKYKGDNASMMRIYPRDPSYTDYVSWISVNANTNRVIKAGTKIVCIVGRTM